MADSGIPYSLRFYAESGWRLGPNSYFTGKILCIITGTFICTDAASAAPTAHTASQTFQFHGHRGSLEVPPQGILNLRANV